MQIEKGLAPITWGCGNFDQYLYGWDKVTVETDHEPLKPVLQKAIHNSPKCLQQMHLALQKYNLEVQYKNNSLMYIADALRCAYLWDSCTWDGESRRVHSSLTSGIRCFPAAHRWRCWYPGANPCDQAKLAWQENVPSCCSAILWLARWADRVARSSGPWSTACGAPVPS